MFFSPSSMKNLVIRDCKSNQSIYNVFFTSLYFQNKFLRNNVMLYSNIATLMSPQNFLKKSRLSTVIIIQIMCRFRVVRLHYHLSGRDKHFQCFVLILIIRHEVSSDHVYLKIVWKTYLGWKLRDLLRLLSKFEDLKVFGKARSNCTERYQFHYG